MNLDLNFWQKVKDDYLNNNQEAHLCYASELFEDAYNEEYYYIGDCANYFLIENKNKYPNCRVGILALFLFGNNRASFSQARQIRLDFIDYMITKLKNN